MSSSTQRLLLLLLATFSCGMAPTLAAAKQPSPRQELTADQDWKFALGDPADAATPSFNDSGWRTVNLPHDWSIESIPVKTNPTGASGGYYPAGVGWYRKSFTASRSWKGKRVSVEFDGVSMDTTVYLNGQKLGNHPYAYTSFRFDLTPQLGFSGRSVLAVKVDNSLQQNSRWYTGSGIYRHVRIVVEDPVHIAPWGVFVSTPAASAASASVIVATEVENQTAETAEVTVKTVLLDPKGTPSGEVSKTIQMPAGQIVNTTQETVLNQPALWSPRNAQLYRAVTSIVKNGKVVDELQTPFGVRTIAWSVDKGLLLNGESIKLAGGSVHHDNGPLGAAAFDRAEERKVQLLKAAGFNAVRTAHNPPSQAFLDACDRYGLLVVDEPFDVWTVSKRTYDYARFFNDWWQRDVDAMVKRDRNHPSIILWGIGNEIPEVWTTAGAPLARQLSARVRSLDSTRPITQAFPGATYGPNPDAAIAQVDVAGYNYNLAQNQVEDHRRVPERIMMTTESFPADAFEQWELVQQHPYIVGEFVWASMDYLGESGIGAWSYGTAKQSAQLKQMKNFLRVYLAKMGADGKNPMAPFQNGQPPSALSPEFPWHASYCGDLDLTGFRKPSSYYRDILWNGGDRVFATVRLPESDNKSILAAGWSVYPTLPSWTWPEQAGKLMTVEVYSGTERVRLYLNDKLIAEKPTGRDQAFKAEFELPYAAGTLKAVGVRGDRVVAESILQTTGAPTQLKLSVDRRAISADGQDLAFVTVEATDSKGNLEMHNNQLVHFTLSGAGTLAAVGNGDGQSQRSYAGEDFELFNGRALAVLRATHKAGAMKLTVTGDTLKAASLQIESRPATSLRELQR